MDRENSFEIETAREIGAAIRERYNPPTLEAGDWHLSSFTRWANCIVVLGHDVAMKAANEGFMEAELRLSEMEDG